MFFIQTIAPNGEATRIVIDDSAVFGAVCAGCGVDIILDDGEYEEDVHENGRYNSQYFCADCSEERRKERQRVLIHLQVVALNRT